MIEHDEGYSILLSRRLTLEEQELVRRYVEELGERGAAAELGVDRKAVLRALGGLRVRRTTATRIREALSRQGTNGKTKRNGGAQP